jgi:hypothetical protein
MMANCDYPTGLCCDTAGLLPMLELDAIVRESLHSFYPDICSEWCGRENEMVNLYAWGHLRERVKPNTILSDFTQIGIEVAVCQLPKEVLIKWKPTAERPKKDVRKDLVIWPSARMSRWKDNVPCNEPLAIMEWKVDHYFNRNAHPQNRREHLHDVEWLRETSLRSGMTNFVGYAVLVEHTHTPKTLTCVRVQAGNVDKQFVTEPTGMGSNV